MELNEYTLSSPMIPDLPKIPPSSVTKVLTKYEQISSIPLPSLLRQIEERFGPRVELDEAVLEALGNTPEEAGRILDSLYEVITNEIHVLTKQMEES